MTDKLADALIKELADSAKPDGSCRQVQIPRHYASQILLILKEHEAAKAATRDDVREAVGLLRGFVSDRKNFGGETIDAAINTVCNAALRQGVTLPREVDNGKVKCEPCDGIGIPDRYGFGMDTCEICNGDGRLMAADIAISLLQDCFWTDTNVVDGGHKLHEASRVEKNISKALAILDQHARGG